MVSWRAMMLLSEMEKKFCTLNRENMISHCMICDKEASRMRKSTRKRANYGHTRVMKYHGICH